MQLERATIRLGITVAVEVAAASPRPPLLFQYVQIPFLLQLQNPVMGMTTGCTYFMLRFYICLLYFLSNSLNAVFFFFLPMADEGVFEIGKSN